jgi:hypothetical protein
MSTPVEGCDRIGHCQTGADDKDALICANIVRPAGLQRINDDTGVAHNASDFARWRWRRVRRGYHDVRCVDRQSIGFDSPDVAITFDRCHPAAHVLDPAVSDQRFDLGGYIGTEERPARKDTAIARQGFRVVDKTIGCLYPANEMTVVAGYKRHPIRWHVDPVRRLVRVIGKTGAKLLARLENDNPGCSVSDDQLKAKRRPREPAADDRDHRSAVNWKSGTSRQYLRSL